MPEPTPQLNVSTEDDVTIVELVNRKILDEVNILRIGEQLDALVAGKDAPKLVVDFAKVGHLSSSALKMLITLDKRIRRQNGQLRLCNIQPPIYEIFAITRLNEIFTIAATRREALAGLN